MISLNYPLRVGSIEPMHHFCVFFQQHFSDSNYSIFEVAAGSRMDVGNQAEYFMQMSRDSSLSGICSKQLELHP